MSTPIPISYSETLGVSLLSDIPRFCMKGLPKIFDFGYFILIWW